MATDRAVDLIEERIDLALRVRSDLTSDAALTMRSLGRSTRILVSSPQIANRVADLQDLTVEPVLATHDAADELEWHLESIDGRKHVVRVQPRMSCEDMATVLNSTIDGLGVALPDHVCREALEAGALVRILPNWHGLQGIVQLVFTTRRGLPPAVRALIDHLAAEFPRDGDGARAHPHAARTA